jgi:hypothetical protein
MPRPQGRGIFAPAGFSARLERESLYCDVKSTLKM